MQSIDSIFLPEQPLPPRTSMKRRFSAHAGHLPGYCAPHSWPRNGSCWILDQKKRKETPTTHEPSTKKNTKKRQTIEDLRSNDAPAA